MTQAFVAEVKAVIAIAETRYNLDLSGVAIRCDIRGFRCAGQAGWRSKYGQQNWYLRFHPLAIEKYWDTMVSFTIPHEVAHTVCQKLPHLGKNHDMGWKRVCRSLGGNALVRHSMDLGRLEYRQKRSRTVSKKFLYSCSLGGTIELGLGRHNSLRSGKYLNYSHPTKGKIFKDGFIRQVA